MLPGAQEAENLAWEETFFPWQLVAENGSPQARSQLCSWVVCDHGVSGRHPTPYGKPGRWVSEILNCNPIGNSPRVCFVQRSSVFEHAFQLFSNGSPNLTWLTYFYMWI